MLKVCMPTVLAVMLWGCVVPTAAWKGEIEWPDEHSARLVVQPMEAGAALAAAAAIREMVRTNPYPLLFRGCSSPEQGLDVAIFTGPTPGLYYVVLHQRFDRCGGPIVRVLDGWYEYAVTPQGEVVAEAPPMAGEDVEALPLHPSPPASEQTPSPATPPPSEAGDTSALTPRPAAAPAPEAPPPDEPSPASPPPVPPMPAGTQGPASAGPRDCEQRALNP